MDSHSRTQMHRFFFRIPKRRHNLGEIVTDIHHLMHHFEQQGEPLIHVVTAYATHGSDWGPKLQAAESPEPFG